MGTERGTVIELKSRYGGKVLYTAESAADVKAAVEEAVRGGAHLRGAHLRGAHLRGAHLRGADLGGADLGGADLGGAYLRGAYLYGADLGAADLGGADLGAADLGAADLGGAHLRGADLGGANMGAGVWAQVADKLEHALAAMNDSGRHWIKASLTQTLDDGSQAYCSVGSIQACSVGTVQAVALWLLGSVAGGSVEAFNDHPDTSWEDVRQVFGVAVMHARRFAKAAE